MEIEEAVEIGTENVDEKVSCDHQEKKSGNGWKARVNGLGQDSTKCSGTNLYEEKPHGMWARHDEHRQGKSLGVVPKKMSNDHWAKKGLAAVNPDSFPLQAHHLIPKNFLPKHEVCVWLCKKDNRHKKYQLSEDSFYNTDHANNGYAMPYATPLKEWKEAEDDDAKTHVAFRVMELAEVQLHQGSHAAILDITKVNAKLSDDKKIPVNAASSSTASDDDMEEAQIHDVGYLDAIEEWLNAVYARVLMHVKTCTKGCRDKQQGKKISVPPLADTVTLMNQVSHIAKVFLTLNIIFACPYGAAYAKQKDLLVWDNTRKRFQVRIKPGREQDIRDLTRDDINQALRPS